MNSHIRNNMNPNEQFDFILNRSKYLNRKELSNNNIRNIINDELNCFEANKHLGLNLNKLINDLECIKPISISPERTFSVAGQFKTKIMSKLSDKSLDSLVYFK